MGSGVQYIVYVKIEKYTILGIMASCCPHSISS